MTRFGTTFSQIQCKYLKLDYQETLQNILNLPLDIIRVCAYWDEIETHESDFNFATLDTIINCISKTNKQIVLAVGMKSPRWPEFHFPQWIKEKYNTGLAHIPIDSQAELSEKAFRFISAVLTHYRDNPAITYIQIENEAFNNFGFTGNKYISYTFVRRAVSFARTISPERKIILTNAINLSPIDWAKSYENPFKKNTKIADAIGVNVYTKVPINKTHYAVPTFFYWWRLARWQKQMKMLGIESWITEAQSEPWEYKNAVHTEKEDYPSASPQQTKDLIQKLSNCGYDTILLWGCEYWYWHKKQGRLAWWETIQSL